MKKTKTILAVLLFTAVLLGACKQRISAPEFTHGAYQIGYTTAVTLTDDEKPAVQVTFLYYIEGGKKVQGAYPIGQVFGDGGLYGIYLKVDGLAYPITSVGIALAEDGKRAAISVVEVPGVSKASVVEVCSAGLDNYVERDGNRIYYATYLLGELAENGNKQVLIDFAYINGIALVRDDAQISGPCSEFSDEIRTIMEKEPFLVNVGGTEYVAESLSASIYGTKDGNLAFGRLMLKLEVPPDTSAGVVITMR